MNDRTMYLASIVAISAISIVGAIFSVVGLLPLGIAFIGIAIALLSVSSHLRMRRMVSSIARSIPATQAKGGADYSAQFKSLSAKVEDLSQSVNLISRQTSVKSDSETDRAARDLQRETRALRLTLREIEGLDASALRSSFQTDQQSIDNEELK